MKAKLEATEEEFQAAQEELDPPLAFEDSWEAYLRSNERNDTGERTLSDYTRQWGTFCLWIKDNHADLAYLRDVPSKVASQYMDTLRSKSPNTYHKHLATLKMVYNVLKEPGRVDVNPFQKVKRRRPQTESRRALSVEELRAILTEATGNLELLLALGTFTGLRLGDCCTLKWGEVDLVSGVIRRVPNKIRFRKKDSVVVGIPPMLAALLGQIPKSKRRGYVLPEIAQRYARQDTTIAEMVQGHLKSCVIQTHREGTGKRTGKRAVVEVGFHSLRHTYVSLHAERGTPQAVVQAVVGHSSPAMTQHYTHISESTARQLSSVIDLDSSGPDHREPLPQWAIEIVRTLTAQNWQQVKQELLAIPGL